MTTTPSDREKIARDEALGQEAAFLVALAEHGISPDIGELLVYGSMRQGIAPGALRKAIAAILASVPVQTDFQPTRKSEDKYLGSRTDAELAAHFATMYHGWERGLNITQEVRMRDGEATFTETPMTPLELAARYVAAEIGLNIYEIANKAAFAPIIVYSQIQARIGPVFEKMARAVPDQGEAVAATFRKLFGTDTACLAMLLHLAQRCESMNDGPFKQGFEFAIEEGGAYLDSECKDGGSQAQDLMQQIILLINGDYALVETPKRPLGVVQSARAAAPLVQTPAQVSEVPKWLNGEPYYCSYCGSGGGEYAACEDVRCELESPAVARARRDNAAAPQGDSGTKSNKGEVK